MQKKPEYEWERVVLPAGQNLYFEHIDYSTQKEKVKHSKHFHEMYEVMLFDHFRGWVWVDGEVYPVDGSYLVYVHPLAIHEYNWGGGTTSWYIAQFNNKLLSQIGFETPLPRFPKIIKLKTLELMRIRSLFSWYNELESFQDSGNIRTDILKVILRWVGEHGNGAGNNFQSDGLKAFSKFHPFLEYLEENEKYTMSVAEAAKLCSLSRSHFLAMFKKQFKITFSQFLLNRRINTAKMYLVEQDLNISDISRRLEFREPTYFTKVFKDEVNLTPREFKKRIRGVLERAHG